MTTKPIINENERVYINNFIMSLAEGTSASSAKFSFRMLVGYAAILGALIANLEAASKFLAKDTLWILALLFSVTLLLNLIQSYLSAMVALTAEAARQVKPATEDVNFMLVIAEIEKATLKPFRKFLRARNQKMLAGDFFLSSRSMAMKAQIASWLMFVQGLITIAAILVLAYGLCAGQLVNIQG